VSKEYYNESPHKIRAINNGDMDIFDAMFIAPYVVGFRNAYFEWIGGPIRILPPP